MHFSMLNVSSEVSFLIDIQIGLMLNITTGDSAYSTGGWISEEKFSLSKIWYF